MQLYLFAASPNAVKPSVVAYHTGLNVERIMVDLRQGAQKSPEFLKLNPNGKMPVLVDGDFVLWESTAIMAYLAHKANSPLWPIAPQAQADVMRWLSWELAHWGPSCAILLRENLVKKVMQGQDPDPAEVQRGLDAFRLYAGILDNHLKGRPYVSGDALTIADYGLAAPLSLAEAAGLPVSEFSALKSWFGRVAAEPAWGKAMADAARSMGR